MILKTSNIIDFTLKFDAFNKFIAKVKYKLCISHLQYTSPANVHFWNKKPYYLLLNDVDKILTRNSFEVVILYITSLK